MDKKRNTKSVVLTIIVTVIVLVVLSVIGVRYLMPIYAMEHGTSPEGMHYKIYSLAVRLFPLLVGIVLIIIASMIAGNKDDEVDEDDLLPPNAYDSQLFEKPSDDPVGVPAPAAESIPEPVKPEVVTTDTISDEDFFAIFGNPEDHKEEEPEEEEVAPVEDAPVEEAPVVEEAPKEEAEPVQVVTNVAVPVAPASDNKELVDAIYALVRKLDDLVEEEDEEEEVEEEEVEEEKEEVCAEDVPQSELAALEKKVDSLCDSVARLSALIAGGLVFAAPKAEEPEPEVVPEPVAVVAPQPEPETIVKTVEVPVDKQINDYDPNDPVQLMKIEFDSAQENEYDITFAFTKSGADVVKQSLGEIAYVFSVNNKTIAVIPFLSDEEAQAELDGKSIKHTTVFVKGGEKTTFEKAILPKI